MCGFPLFFSFSLRLVACTALSGAMLVGMGALGLGDLISRVPKPIVAGFTAGIAVFIFSTQMAPFTGLAPSAGAIPAEFVDKVGAGRMWD